MVLDEGSFCCGKGVKIKWSEFWFNFHEVLWQKRLKTLEFVKTCFLNKIKIIEVEVSHFVHFILSILIRISIFIAFGAEEKAQNKLMEENIWAEFHKSCNHHQHRNIEGWNPIFYITFLSRLYWNWHKLPSKILGFYYYSAAPPRYPMRFFTLQIKSKAFWLPHNEAHMQHIKSHFQLEFYNNKKSRSECDFFSLLAAAAFEWGLPKNLWKSNCHNNKTIESQIMSMAI